MIGFFRNVALALSMLMLSGCTMWLWHVNDVKEYGSRRGLAYSDVIYSAFEYKDITLQVQEKERMARTLALPSAGVGFIGEKNIYFVTRNGDALLSLNTLMKSVSLRRVSNNKYIEIDITENKYATANATFYQSFSIRTLQPEDKLAALQKEALVKQGFRVEKGYYQKTFIIEGFIIDRQRLNREFPETEALHERYQVRFYTTKLKSSYSGSKLATNILLTPVTLVGDILLLPFILVVSISE